PIAISSTGGTIPYETLKEGDYIPVSINTYTTAPATRNGFGFLSWRVGPTTNDENAAALTNAYPNGSLSFPGNSQSNVPVSNAHSYLSAFSSANQLRRGVWVLYNSTGLTTAVKNILEGHKNAGRTLRVLVYDLDAPQDTAEKPVTTTSNLNP